MRRADGTTTRRPTNRSGLPQVTIPKAGRSTISRRGVSTTCRARRAMRFFHPEVGAAPQPRPTSTLEVSK
jgi:hypothetical protein